MAQIHTLIKNHKIAMFGLLDKKRLKLHTRIEAAGGLTILNGPPYASGKMHIGTVYNSILKDFYLRYYRMLGYQVSFSYSYDMHGLPIAVKVEQNSSEWSRSKISTNPGKFIAACREFAIRNRSQMIQDLERLKLYTPTTSYWSTIDPCYAKMALDSFKNIFDKGHVYQKSRINNVCIRCNTSLSDSELEWVEGSSKMHYFGFDRGKNDYIIISTTAPWSLPGNVGIAYNKNVRYVRIAVETPDGKITCIMSKIGVSKFISVSGFKLLNISDISIADLKSMEYLNCNSEKRKMYHAEFVTGVGTGLVHISPANGQEDNRLAKKNKIEYKSTLDLNGKYVMGAHAGRSISDTAYWTSKIFNHFGCYNHTHRHAKCWRCSTKIAYIECSEWYINANPIGIANQVNKTLWNVTHAKSELIKNFKLWPNWCISRNRLWGFALPIWKCPKCGKFRCDVHHASNPYTPNADLATIFCNCELTPTAMTREPAVLDVWYDSGVAHNMADRTKPVIIVEGIDQIRGWFRSLAISSYLDTGHVAYDQVICHGFVDYKRGIKWSKSKIEQQCGPDSTVFDIVPADMSATRAGLLMQPVGKRFMLPNFNVSLKYMNTLKNFKELLKFYKIMPPRHAYLKLLRASTQLTHLDKWILIQAISMWHNVKIAMLEFCSDAYSIHVINFTIHLMSQKYVKHAKKDIKKHKEVLSILIGFLNSLATPISGQSGSDDSRLEISEFENLIAILFPEYFKFKTRKMENMGLLELSQISTRDSPISYIPKKGEMPKSILESSIVAHALNHMVPAIRALKRGQGLSVGDWISEVGFNIAELDSHFGFCRSEQSQLTATVNKIDIGLVNQVVSEMSKIFRSEKISVFSNTSESQMPKIIKLDSEKTKRLNKIRGISKKISKIRKILGLAPGVLLLLDAKAMFQSAKKINYKIPDCRFLTVKSDKLVVFEGSKYAYKILR